MQYKPEYNRFQLNCHPSGLHPQTQNFESPCKTGRRRLHSAQRKIRRRRRAGYARLGTGYSNKFNLDHGLRTVPANTELFLRGL